MITTLYSKAVIDDSYTLSWPVSLTHPIRGHLFPRLKCLHLHIQHSRFIFTIIPLLHSNLIELNLGLDAREDKPIIDDFLVAAVRVCSRLRSLSLHNQSTSLVQNPRITVLPKLVMRLGFLRELRLSGRAVELTGTLRPLSTLKNLELLIFDPPTALPWKLEKLGEGAFSRLNSIRADLSVEFIDLITKEHFPRHQLQNIQVQNCGAGRTHLLLDAISGHEIKELTLLMQAMVGAKVSDLWPISSLRHLQRLKIVASIDFVIADVHFNGLISGCEALQELVLTTSRPPELTLLSILSVLEQCNNISLINIPINATGTLPLHRKRPETVASNNGVGGTTTRGVLPRVAISMSSWEVSNKDAVLDWLAGLCINLDILDVPQK